MLIPFAGKTIVFYGSVVLFLVPESSGRDFIEDLVKSKKNGELLNFLN